MMVTEIASFEACHDQLSWPWVTFDASGRRFAFVSAGGRIRSRVLEAGAIVEGPTFVLPEGVGLAGVQGFSLSTSGAQLALLATLGGASHLVTLSAAGEARRTSLEALAEAGFRARATAFDRTGEHVWISAESATETAILLVDAGSHERIGIARSAAFPPPSMHEIHLHPQDDAVLLLAACGEEGTFARVAGWSGGGVETIPTALDDGSVAAGFVGFSADVERVHLAEADELRTHAWPGLDELSSVELADDFVSSFSGVVIGERVYVDGEDAETREDQVMQFDRSATVGALLPEPGPAGMWAGRLGRDLVVTVESKGEPARGRVVRIA